MTHWQLADGTKVEVVNFIDDYSRVAVGSQVFSVTTAPALVSTFYKCAEKWGFRRRC
jgi:hypothetical protein